MPDDSDRSHDTDPLADTQSSSHESSERIPDKRRSVHAGDTLGRYELVEEVGEGGMATVFRARDRELRREVAIKVLFPHLARRVEVVRRFHREARAAAGLEHANILRVYDVGGAEGEDPPYIVMELIRGHSLLAEIERRGPMLAEVAACIGALLADALAVAHQAGIIHRDVKPANVMIAAGGQLLLADFGVARLETEDSLVTKTGSVLGTPAYMSPEQASGDTATSRSDLYSLGATLYQLATGSLPYTGSTARVLSQIAQGLLVPASRKRSAVGPDLSRVIDRLMATEPTARPPKASEVAAELRAIATAGGLGDPTDELAAYFASPDAFVADRLPKVVTAVVALGQRAAEEDKLPRAIALADRASALAPEDPAVTALVHTVTEGGKATRRRRVMALTGAGLLLAGGATFGAMRLMTAQEPVVADAAIAVATPDSVVINAGVDAAAIDTAVVAMALDAVPPDASAVRVRVDAAVARPTRDATIDAAPPIDAPGISIDAAVPLGGAIVVRNDTWCDVSIDNISRGRRNDKPIRVDAGHHIVTCEQHGTGMQWSRDVEVGAGETKIAAGAMLGTIAVTLGVDATINGLPYQRGTVVHLKGGRYDLAIGDRKGRFDLREPCVIRAAPEPGCY